MCQGRSKRLDRVDNIEGPASPGGPNQNEQKQKQTKNPLVWGPLTVSCPWAPEGLATPVKWLVFCFEYIILSIRGYFVSSLVFEHCCSEVQELDCAIRQEALTVSWQLSDYSTSLPLKKYTA